MALSYADRQTLALLDSEPTAPRDFETADEHQQLGRLAALGLVYIHGGFVWVTDAGRKAKAKDGAEMKADAELERAIANKLSAASDQMANRLAGSRASNDHWQAKFAALSSLLERCGFVVNVDHKYLSRAGTQYHPEDHAPELHPADKSAAQGTQRGKA